MKYKVLGVVAAIVVVVLAIFAYQRSGLLDLPEVPDNLTADMVGLGGIDTLRFSQNKLDSGSYFGGVNDKGTTVMALGAEQFRKGTHERGLKMMRMGLRFDPNNLALGNGFRLCVLDAQREFLRQAAKARMQKVRLPVWLDNEPKRTFESRYRIYRTRELKFQMAMGLIDKMLLYPALEIKAPASVEAVELLTEILEENDGENKYYVPALFARGLNYLYRPADLEWPESIKSSPTAASDDIALCVAIGQKVGVGSDELKARLSMTLGDAYCKEGNISKARSWWQVAYNLNSADKAFVEDINTRTAWDDDEAAQNLERLLEKQMNDLKHPLTDMRFMWK